MSAKRRFANSITENDDNDTAVTFEMHAAYCHLITKNVIYYVVALAIATLEIGTPPTICKKLGLDYTQCISELLYHITILQKHNLLKNTGAIDLTSHIELRPIPDSARRTLSCILLKQKHAMKKRIRPQ